MLRNSLNPVLRSYKLRHEQQLRLLNLSCNYCAKNSFNINRQGKILSKLFGERIKGSKKHWYPTTDSSTRSTNAGHSIFNATKISKPSAGKNSSRRSAVLNKLFMEQISSLLATGEIADTFLGRGLQLMRVKIAPDFAFVNVYWLGTADPLENEKLSEDLKRCSGLLRHELSQMRVMGEVPRINFVQDKRYANMEHVDALLRNLDFGDESNESEENKKEFHSEKEARVKEDFYGNSDKVKTIELDQYECLPPMRHDVFGLDHHGITSKILSKMRKTKQAWEALDSTREGVTSMAAGKEESFNGELTKLKNVQKRLEETSRTSSEEFKKFLAQRQERKSTPERKKYRRADDLSWDDEYEDRETDVIASKEEKYFLNAEDYLNEEHGEDRKL